MVKVIRLVFVALLGLLPACGSVPSVTDCLTCISTGGTCSSNPDGSFHCEPRPTPTPNPGVTPRPTPTPDPGATPRPTPTPDPGATPRPTPTSTATPAPPTPTPPPTATPCAPTKQRVCVKADGTVFPFDRNACWTCADWQGYMIRNGYFTAGDPREDGDAPGGGHPGYWLNYNAAGVLVGLISKRDCTNAQGNLVVDWPRAEERVVPCATPTPGPTSSPTPGPTPSPGPGGCPGLLKVGGMFLSAVDCGASCRRQGYLGVRVNVTATELCREGDPGCVCDPARNRCEMPRPCQNPLGATTYISLPGKFTDDLCDQNSDNFFNCHHKPKADEAGVTTFEYCPHGAPPHDPRCTAKCIDVREVGTREVACR